MAPKVLSTGAYVIYNKKRNGVLHITQENIVTVTESRLELKSRDEDSYPEQQIWWVERIPGYEDSDDPAYSITNTASGKSLLGKVGNASLVCQSSGEIWQKWKLLEPKSEYLEEGRAYYSIFDFTKVYTICGGYHGTYLVTHNRDDRDKFWEFIEPNTKFAAGWLEVSNAETGDLLNHTYLTSPPHLIPPPKQDKDYKLPMYRERWGTQWSISRYAANCATSQTESETSWVIKNRLTGGRLSLNSSLGVVGEKQNGSVSDEERWIVEFRSGETIWRIKNTKNSCYLEQTTDTVDTNIKLACTEKSYMRWPMDKNKKWCFRYVMHAPKIKYM